VVDLAHLSRANKRPIHLVILNLAKAKTVTANLKMEIKLAVNPAKVKMVKAVNLNPAKDQW
jgi:hypothetical protein